ncbi:MAG TPA: hypothetical protein VFM46_12685, partial [Pseudomonadales bacterium]|nr:hypothetical protein [Pseudomonadales bacterium]
MRKQLNTLLAASGLIFASQTNALTFTEVAREFVTPNLGFFSFNDSGWNYQDGGPLPAIADNGHIAYIGQNP